MTTPADSPPRNETPNERLSSLTAAMLRISASLDLETVFREVAESARTLTGARYGAIVTIDEKGEPQDFVTSGLTDDAHRALVEWSDGLRLFEHFRDLPGPLRLSDVPEYVRSLGFASDRLPSSRTFQGTPMRHRGRHVGNFYLVEKEGEEEFTSEDEEVLVLFASQAASAIANARAYRDEQRARADLEALVETSPVGVVVFDARTGRVVSLNREAKRIVESLRMPGRTAEELLKVLTCRRGDGREIALDRFPLAGALSSAETVRAEEIVLSTPDGRSVTTLVNATPIQADDGEVESVVVTLQDLAPLEELDRMRAEFLGMVSHELRTPLAAIKGSTATVLGASPGFGTAETQQFFRIIDEQAGRMSGLIGDRHQTLAAQAGSHLTLRLRTRAVLRSQRVRSSCGRPPGSGGAHAAPRVRSAEIRAQRGAHLRTGRARVTILVVVDAETHRRAAPKRGAHAVRELEPQEVHRGGLGFGGTVEIFVGHRERALPARLQPYTVLDSEEPAEHAPPLVRVVVLQHECRLEVGAAGNERVVGGQLFLDRVGFEDPLHAQHLLDLILDGQPILEVQRGIRPDGHLPQPLVGEHAGAEFRANLVIPLETEQIGTVELVHGFRFRMPCAATTSARPEPNRPRACFRCGGRP